MDLKSGALSAIERCLQVIIMLHVLDVKDVVVGSQSDYSSFYHCIMMNDVL